MNIFYYKPHFHLVEPLKISKCSRWRPFTILIMGIDIVVYLFQVKTRKRVYEMSKSYSRFHFQLY